MTGETLLIRHYCQGIGDCHLLGFPREGGRLWMLIDCGIHPFAADADARLRRVVEDVLSVTDRIDILVVTHEHMDHLSGFVRCRDLFAKMTVGEVWLPWTENPQDKQAGELDRYRGKALSALARASERLSLSGGETATALDAVLGFSFGVRGERVRTAREAAVALAPGNVRYWNPGDPPVEVVPGIRAFPLGPPRDAALLGLTDKPGEMFEFSGPSGWPMEKALTGGFVAVNEEDEAADRGAPFAAEVGGNLRWLEEGVAADKEADLLSFARKTYFGGDDWRRIDHDWLDLATDLALQLDDRTNNTSLVLAFEMGEGGRVALFPGDAQIGSWMSWPDVRWTLAPAGREVTGADLMARTVYLKVSHHGSHNATRKAGLAMMTSPDLAVFIPTNAEDARKVRWHRMPLPGIVSELGRRTCGRVLRADDRWETPLIAPGGAIAALRRSDAPNLWVEVELR